MPRVAEPAPVPQPGRLLAESRRVLREALALRVKNRDLAGREVTVRAGKGAKDRRRVLPDAAVAALAAHLARVQLVHARHAQAGTAGVPLPHAFAR